MCQKFGIESDVIPRIASCFGGGIGNTGSVCGAVIGAVMAIGLVKERGNTMEDWLNLAAVAREFRGRFEAELGSIGCRELTGVDLTTEEGLKQAMNADTAMMVCFPAVDLAYRLVMDLLEAPGSRGE